MHFRTILTIAICLGFVPGAALAQRQVQLAPLTLQVNSLALAEQRLGELEALIGVADRTGAALLLSRAQRAEGARLQAQFAATPNSGEALQAWAGFAASAGAGASTIDSLVQWVMRQAYADEAAALREMIEKVKSFNERKQAIRDELARIDAHPCRPPQCQAFQTNASFLRTSFGSAFLTRPEQLATYRAELVAQEAAIDPQAQAMQIELQNLMHQQDAAMQLLSNVARNMHDAAMAAIQNVR